MAEIQVYKTKMTKACGLIKKSEPEVNRLDQAFAFPQERKECEAYVREKTAQLNHLMRTVMSNKRYHYNCLKEAIEIINSRPDEKKREKLMTDLNDHLQSESNELDITVMRWQNKVDFRKDELSQQTVLIASCQEGSNGNCTVTGKGGSNSTSTNGAPPPQERNVALRRPLLEVPNFSGDLREFNAFWSVFETLIHNDASLTDQEKFLFLKQALKGEAAASITYVPVIGEKYCVAVNILKKQYDRSAMMADILISEIEKIPRAHDTPKSCRDTLSAITSRITHLEQTGVSIKADRVWRRLILSKFTEYICGRVIRKESKTGIPLEVNDIIEAVDEIVTLQETTELTTATLFGTYLQETDDDRFSRQNEPHQIELCSSWNKLLPLCLCGDTHRPQYCTTFTTPEERRNEARQRKLCWKCFRKGHTSNPAKSVVLVQDVGRIIIHLYAPQPQVKRDRQTVLAERKTTRQQ
ncbi:unnamed protein product [Heligmosomoides polygyrus]|uniref:DUF1758 domain-containing protein n=1 Tax=Heligmosomoides polygyrus TaxID=6339 RepID=A0A183GFG7_HELPZ|nr:unnamed protein product [Heligmosomoides polygyrus]